MKSQAPLRLQFWTPGSRSRPGIHKSALPRAWCASLQALKSALNRRSVKKRQVSQIGEGPCHVPKMSNGRNRLGACKDAQRQIFQCAGLLTSFLEGLLHAGISIQNLLMQTQYRLRLSPTKFVLQPNQRRVTSPQ